MAANPEQGPIEQGPLGTWQTLSLVVPDFLEPVREDLDLFFGFLGDLLNLLSKVLNIAKVFATGLLDPVTAIVQRIRDYITGLLESLRQVGVYLHGDFYLLEGPEFSALRGGFAQYEARMVARLLDPQDPNRPDLNEDTTVAAVFLYVGADIRGIDRIVRLLRAIANLFDRAPATGQIQTRPTNVQATYGFDGATIFSFNPGFFRAFSPRSTGQILDPYNAVNLTWEMSTSSLQRSLAQFPPAGFLVSFSTLPGPLALVCERPIQGSLAGVQYPTTSETREVVPIVDDNGDPILLRGGADFVQYDEALTYNQPVNTDTIRVYAVIPSLQGGPIALEELQEGGRYFLQRTFFVPFLQNMFFPGRRYGATFQFKDMPYHAQWELDVPSDRTKRVKDTQQPETLYVSVRAVTRAVQGAQGFQYVLDQNFARDQSRSERPSAGLRNPDTVSLLDISAPSDVFTVLFPDTSTQRFLQALSEALAICVLCRIGLPVLRGKSGVVDFPPTSGQVLVDGRLDPYWKTYEGHARLETGLEDVAPSILPSLVAEGYYERSSLPGQFRKDLLRSCVALTNSLFRRTSPSTPARQYALEKAADLLAFRVDISDMGISTEIDDNASGRSLMGWLQQEDTTFGLAQNPTSLGIVNARASALAARALWGFDLLPRAPHFFSVEASSGRGRGSADNSPLAYYRSGNRIQSAAFVRNLVPDSVYEGAQAVLQVALGPLSRPPERGWIAFRLFPQGLPEVEGFFNRVLGLLQAVQEALDSLAEAITRYIEYLQSKIADLQAILNQLQALLNTLLRFFASIAPTAGLVLTANGTAGVVSGLLNASDKPTEPPNPTSDAYGGGVVLVAGGIPNAAITLLLNLFKGEG